MEKLIGVLLGLIVVVLIATAMGALWTLPLWLFWKYIAVSVFGAPSLSFLQSWFVVGALLSIRALLKG